VIPRILDLLWPFGGREVCPLDGANAPVAPWRSDFATVNQRRRRETFIVVEAAAVRVLPDLGLRQGINSSSQKLLPEIEAYGPHWVVPTSSTAAPESHSPRRGMPATAARLTM
jgi:hypothetical protein